MIIRDTSKVNENGARIVKIVEMKYLMNNSELPGESTQVKGGNLKSSKDNKNLNVFEVNQKR